VHRTVPLLLIEIPGLPTLTVRLTVKSLRPAADCHPLFRVSGILVRQALDPQPTWPAG